ncbi:hypothetical protein acsn021_05070 [Anaerocolumna cellulosilytica]|uniref:Uncharacterized protein n=1 Tax=Anaerocolumna cellulosilytica TaxID=433286 RepID=A0A6S6R1R0_9FIRM|nr:flagellar protein FlaG [Anaerocolumna cellulosilytica]MBB5195726.1 putative FlaG/YvyC family protein [Anaerocolumna cellulosilytica]BCJ92938.1 hypothetical protein acsn021_05070 [Anaerocolumna cellulosilytica]
MAVNSVSNTGAAYIDSKTEQKVQSAVKAAAISGVAYHGVKVQGGTGKEDREDTQVDAKRVKNIVDETNHKIKDSRRRLEFSYNEEIKRVSIKVMDEVTNEVIKEIPPEKTLEMIQKMWEVAGLLIDERL